MALAIANRYASALADVVSQPDSALAPEQALAQLKAFEATLNDPAELRSVLLAPSVRPDDKRAVIAQICTRLGCAEEIRNFIYVVADHRRTAMFGEFVEAFRSWLDSKQGLARIEVRTALAMDPDQQASLERRFAAITGNSIEASYVVDERVLGGSVVRVDSTIYDGSLRAKLQQLDRAMRDAG